MAIIIRPIASADREEWAVLYSGYADFYKAIQTPEMRDRVWSLAGGRRTRTARIRGRERGGPARRPGALPALLAPALGHGGRIMDDLFVSPAARGQEVGKQLIAAIAEVGREKNWSCIRWLTAEDNYRARSSYDKISTRTNFLTYDLKL